MKRTFERYGNVGYRFVSGFLEPGNLPVLKVLDAAQRARNVTGAVAEIGVHHGRLFIPLHLPQRNRALDPSTHVQGNGPRNAAGLGQRQAGPIAAFATTAGKVTGE